MRLELIVFFITAALIANVYTDGKYIALLKSNKKYLTMGGIALGGLMVYILFKKFPERAQNIIRGSNEYVKYLPVDNKTMGMLNPILDFTSRHNFGGSVANPVLDMGAQSTYSTSSTNANMYATSNVGGGSAHIGNGTMSSREARILNSGKGSSKRSVSETKKKYVASRQGWKCGDCGNQLSAWFEVDHKIRLEHGGSNHVDNLVALCRECHGCKTAMENL